MGQKTKIEWCDHTFNPWIGCTKIAAGCANCYAADIAVRFKMAEWGPDGTRRVASERQWQEVSRWDRSAERAGVRRTVFCASMADVFEDWPQASDRPRVVRLVEIRGRLWRLIENTPSLIWLLLTKRPGNIQSMLPDWALDRRNVWLGISVSKQADVDATLPPLVDYCRRHGVPAFVSAEPLLEQITIPRGMVDWIIVGGESGPRARPIEPAWVDSIRADAEADETPFFFKQWGAAWPGNTLNGRQYMEFPKSFGKNPLPSNTL